MDAKTIELFNESGSELAALRAIVMLLAINFLAHRPDLASAFGDDLRRTLAATRLPDGSGPVDLAVLEAARAASLAQLEPMLAQISAQIGRPV